MKGKWSILKTDLTIFEPHLHLEEHEVIVDPALVVVSWYRPIV